MALLQTVQHLLESNNISCTAAFPKRRMPRLLEPAVMLCTNSEKIEPLFLGNLLGQKNFVPAYAFKLNETVACEIYSPYLSGGYQCDNLVSKIIRYISTLLSESVHICIERTATHYDPDTDCFRASVIIRSDTWIQRPSL